MAIDRERLGHALGHYAKLICSAVHVAGREPRAFIATDLVRPDEGLALPWEAIDLHLDDERRTVTLTAPDGCPGYHTHPHVSRDTSIGWVPEMGRVWAW